MHHAYYMQMEFRQELLILPNIFPTPVVSGPHNLRLWYEILAWDLKET